jgi:membrane AbrB-like protein
VLHALGFPSADLFAGVLAGIVFALTSSEPKELPAWASKMAMAIVGVAAGASIDAAVVESVLARPALILGAAAMTIAITLAAGQLLRISPKVSGTTAMFASIAGGASGLTVMARKVGADQGVVGTLQYFRVLIIVLTVPVVSTILGAGEVVEMAESSGWREQWLGAPFALVAIIAGLALAKVLAFSASNLIIPLLVATGLVLTGAFPSYEVPWAVIALGFAPIGLMVGFSLTREALSNLARLLPLAILSLTISLIGSAAVGWTLTQVIDLSFYDAYLATTPGGLHAVAAFAVGSGDDVGFIITAQVARLFFALTVGAVLSSVVQRRRSPPNTKPDPEGGPL